MSEQDGLKLVAQPQEYFRELVTHALESQNVSADPEIEFYLVNLLNQFMCTENLYARDSSGNMKDEPLAFMFKEALDESQSENQKLLFRHVGDVSLYTAGFFQESLNRKCVGIDYYIELGGAAYQKVANQAFEKSLQGLYLELGGRFAEFVNVFALISEKTTSVSSESDLLKMYATWKETGSTRAQKALRKAGIVQDKKKSK